MNADPYRDHSDRVRDLVRTTPTGNRFVFGSAAAGLAVRLVRGSPDPSLILVVSAGLSQPVVEVAARGLARWYRSQGRNILLPDPSSGLRTG